MLAQGGSRVEGVETSPPLSRAPLRDMERGFYGVDVVEEEG
jgi:hypothetical protein